MFSRIRAALAIAALALFIAAVPASAHWIDRGTAESIAQNYQASECGYAATWVCKSSTWLRQDCYARAGYHTYYCSGYVLEQSIYPWVADRQCNILVHLYHTDISYHWNECRHS